MFQRWIAGVVFVVCYVEAGAAVESRVDRYDVVWRTPSKDSSGSMPLGNGDISLNLWVEEGGDLLFYIGKTDAWSENARLLKLGRVRVKLSPNPFKKGAPFVQTLRLRHGEIEVKAGREGSPVVVSVWVDANRPVIRVEAAGQREFDVQVGLEIWRDRERTLSKEEEFSAYGLDGGPNPIVVTADTIRPAKDNRVVWFHRNERSIWSATLKHQGMEAWSGSAVDPLLGRTFGGLIEGSGMVTENATTLRSGKPAGRHGISIHVLTSQTPTAEQWIEQIESLAARNESAGEAARQEHRAWWGAFWERSWICVTGGPEAVSQGYALQRFISACAGRGAMPIKFNGSTFTVDAKEKDETFDADYRRWGGPYWWQNTRLCYWPMMASGDFDTMQPLFRMYREMLPMAKERTRLYFNHGGAYFPETLYFCGSYANSNYGWDRKDKPISHIDNRYIRWEYEGALELLAMMLDCYAYTGDEAFLTETLLPLADEILLFYDQHYKRDSAGRLHLEPEQALETYQLAVNPSTDIAGLQWVLDGLLGLDEKLISPERRDRWSRLRKEVPPLPTGKVDGKKVLIPADKIIEGPNNSENPELYAVFPFRLFGVGKPELDMARLTFAKRRFPGNEGWRQDDIQAALLGLADQAARYVAGRFANKNPGSRFPAFWGPNFDWIPDQDHGNVGMMALQTMLVQAEGRKILLFPAWPKQWDVEFRLRAPLSTTVEGLYRAGKLEYLKVTPESRAGDVVQMPPQEIRQ